MTVTYVKHENIDVKRWDRCIKKSMNGSIYGYSWYLDIVAKHWDALIDENYETVMPLTYRSLLGHKKLIQPHFASNLGVYSIHVLTSETVNLFVSSIPPSFSSICINLNKYNKLQSDQLTIKRDIHYELDLIQPYLRTRERFKPLILDHLHYAESQNITIVPEMHSNDLLQLYRSTKGWWWSQLHRQRIKALGMLVSQSVRFRVGQVYGAYDKDQKLCAAAFFVQSHQKVILLFLCIRKKGFSQHALDAIINQFITLHSDENLTLRFEYTSRKKFADIYTGFGGRRYQFMKIRQHRLSRYLKFLNV